MPVPTVGQLVVFSLGEEEYALPIGSVHEIIRYAEPRSVASTDPSVRGVISLRGKILPVFDLAAKLGLAGERAQDAKIVIVETGDTTAGVVVDDVAEVITVSEDQLDAEGGRMVTGDCVEAIAKIENRLIVLLQPERIVATTDGALAGVPAAAGAPVAAAA
jgi:purine-binding chemotaxis protein CheW